MALGTAVVPLAEPAPPRCAVVEVSSPQKTDSRERARRVRRFSATEILDLELHVFVPATLTGDHRLDVKVYTPDRQLYQVLTVPFENDGEEDVKVNVDAKLCGADGCDIEMNCGDSTILVEDDDTEEVVCIGRATSEGKYRVEAEVTFEGDEDTERSNDFFVYATDGAIPKTVPGTKFGTASNASESVPEEVVEKLKQIKYVCNGNMRQAIFSTTNGVSTSDIEYCQNGCVTGTCRSLKSTASSGKTVLVPGTDADNTPKPVFNAPKYTPPVFDLDNFLGWLKNLLFSEPS